MSVIASSRSLPVKATLNLRGSSWLILAHAVAHERAGVRRDIERLVVAHARVGVAGDVAHGVAARLTAGETGLAEECQHLDHPGERDVVELDSSGAW